MSTTQRNKYNYIDASFKLLNNCCDFFCVAHTSFYVSFAIFSAKHLYYGIILHVTHMISVDVTLLLLRY